MPHLQNEAVVREFWRLMATNDFESVQSVLAENFVLEWPQSNERLRGAENFARMNSEYPSAGKWTFVLHRIVAAEEVVTHVTVSDGQRSDAAISFFTVRDGKIAKLVEFWPETYAAPQSRAHLTEPLNRA